MIEVGFAELHKTLFLGGKNHGERLDSNRFPDLKILLDEKTDRLVVTWKGHTTKVPMTNVANYTEGPGQNRRVAQVASPMIANVSATAQLPVTPSSTKAAFSAQVDTPMSHVHAGEGKGKTGKSK